jgi:hypothetical protein
VGGDDETSHYSWDLSLPRFLNGVTTLSIIVSIQVDGFSKVVKGFKPHTINIASGVMLESSHDNDREDGSPSQELHFANMVQARWFLHAGIASQDLRLGF